jgi:hypothetical protein
MNIFNKFIAITILILIIMGLFVLSGNDKKRFDINTDRTAVIKEIRALSRLETVSFTIEKIIEAGTSGNQLEELFFGDRILLIAHGNVIAGIDLSTISDTNFIVKGEALTFILPAPIIFSSYLDSTKTQVYDRRKGILSLGEKDLESEARKTAEGQIRIAACESDILVQANEKAKTFFQTFFSSLGYSNVTIITKTGRCN